MDRVRNPVAKFDHDYTVTPITTAAWVVISSDFEQACTALEFFDSSGRVLKLATGEPGSEVELPYQVFPGGSGVIPIEINKGVKLSARAVDANATVGRMFVNVFGGF